MLKSHRPRRRADRRSAAHSALKAIAVMSPQLCWILMGTWLKTKLKANPNYTLILSMAQRHSSKLLQS